MVRYPNGVEGDFFHQKRVPSHPDFVGEQYVEFPSGHSTVFAVIDNAAALAWVVNLGCIELHTWHSRVDGHRAAGLSADRPRPDDRRAVAVRSRDRARRARGDGRARARRRIRRRRARPGCTSSRRSSPSSLFPEVRRFAKALAEEVERRVGDQEVATTTWRVADRRGVFVDFGQNTRDRTIATAYSVRPTPDARVSAPLALGRGARPSSLPPSPSRRCATASRTSGISTADMWRRKVSLVPRFPKLGLEYGEPNGKTRVKRT